MKNKKKLDNPVDVSVALIKLGHSDSYIESHLLQVPVNNVTSEEQAKQVVLDAHELISQEHDKNLKDVWMLHKSRYQKEINRLLAVEELDEKQIGISCTYEEW